LKSHCARVSRSSCTDDGVTLIEVMVAMFIFALISMGVIYTMISSLTFVRDSHARSAATSLAAQEIDAARSIDDVFLVTDTTYTKVVDKRTFTVARASEWVSDPDQDVPCGATGGSLKYKRVNVTVSWAGMANTANAVRADTLIAPRERVSNPDEGTILVSVLDSKPAGLKDVVITTVPAQAKAYTTDVDGCGYLLNVKPGKYTVTVSKAGFVSPDQTATVTSQQFEVKKGTSINLPFQLEHSQELTAKLVTTAVIPTNLDLSFLHSSDPIYYNTTTTRVTSRDVLLYPFSDGYTTLAGRYADKSGTATGCLSPNPAAWPETTDNGVSYAPVAAPIVTPVAAPPTQVDVAMGTVAVKLPSTVKYLSAVSQAAAPAGIADPGCAGVTMTYTFGEILTKDETKQIALPFGTWKLYNSKDGTGTAIGATGLVATAPSVVSSTGVVTLDPRAVAP